MSLTQPPELGMQSPVASAEPTPEELVRIRRETGSEFNPNSKMDRKNLELMRAGQQTFDTRQYRQWRNTKGASDQQLVKLACGRRREWRMK
jgi:hypothetical protein